MKCEDFSVLFFDRKRVFHRWKRGEMIKASIVCEDAKLRYQKKIIWTGRGIYWTVKGSFWGNYLKCGIYNEREELVAEIKNNPLKSMIAPCQKIYINGKKVTEIQRKMSLQIGYEMKNMPYIIEVDQMGDGYFMKKKGEMIMEVHEKYEGSVRKDYDLLVKEEDMVFGLCVLIAMDMSNRQLSRSID